MAARIGDNSRNTATIADMEPLKASVAGCMRAIAQDAELEVTFPRTSRALRVTEFACRIPASP